MADLYKARVHARWHNRINGQWMDVRAGTVVEFDEGDFDDPEQADDRGALRSLDDVLVRGVFEPWEESTAGDPEHMSRDELMELATALGATDADGKPLPNNMTEEDARALVQSLLADKDGTSAATRAASRRQRPGGAAGQGD